MVKHTIEKRVFDIFNITFLSISALMCLFPLLHVLAVSFSSSSAAAAGLVKIWPVDFTLKSYEYVLEKKEFMVAFKVSAIRVILGAGINMLLTIVAAYPLSRENNEFNGRSFYVWFFFITMIFSGGLIPTYMVVSEMGLLDSIWALILPGAVPVFNVIILLNFFRQLPKEIGESAFIDGAGHWNVLWKIYVPMSTASLATLLLFSVVGHWNSWFDGIIYMNSTDRYPLQSYLQTILNVRNMDLSMMSKEELEEFSKISDRTAKASQIFIAAFPILCVYPFLQKYYVKGIVIGSVKG